MHSWLLYPHNFQHSRSLIGFAPFQIIPRNREYMTIAYMPVAQVVLKKQRQIYNFKIPENHVFVFS
jgi:hypothetical protein